MKKLGIVLISLLGILSLLTPLPGRGVNVLELLFPNGLGQPGSSEGSQGLQANAAAPNAIWVIETVDSADSVGAYSSLALDAADLPHISYYDETYGDLKYAYHDGTTWQFDVVQSSGNVGRYSSVLLNAAGLPQISYYDYSLADLRHAWHDGTVWQNELVDGTNFSGLHTSLALNAAGQARISYARDGASPYPDPTPLPLGADAGLGSPSANRELRYAWHDGTSWQPPTVLVSNLGTEGGYTSLALDSAGLPHISYYDHLSGNLMHAYYVGAGGNCGGGNWQCDTVDSSAALVGKYTSIVIDATDRPRISYYDESDGNLKYARYDGTTWQIEIVDSDGDVGRYTSLVLDNTGRPHISYLDYAGGNLKYAYYVGAGGNCPLGGDTWQCEVVDGGPAVGGYTSIALDGYELPHISYYDYTNKDLKYAYLMCVSPDGANITGPAFLPTDTDGSYDATYTPFPTATLPITFTWDNGTVGSTAVYSWTVPGTYVITVTVTNRCGQAYDTFVVTVEDPVADLVAINDSPTALGNPTTLTATVSGGTNVTFAWAFGDGGTGSGDVLTHIYPAVGVYTAVVTASNNVSMMVANTIVVVEEAIEGLVAINDSPTALGNPTTLTATTTAGDPLTFAWAFGDDTFGSGAVPMHTYPAVGTYVAVVTASNQVSVMTATTTVIVEEAIADLVAVNDSPTALSDFTTLTATTTAGDPVNFTWAFGDGGTGSGAVLTNTYPAVGSYVAVVTASNQVSVMTATTIVVVEEEVAGLVAVNDSPTALGDFTTLTATTTAGDPLTFAWAFGDGTFGSGAVLTNTYPAVGIYLAVVTASNQVSMMTATTTVVVEEAIVGLVAINDSPTILGNFTTLTATVTAGTNVTFTWAFGDGGTGSGAVLTNTYPAVGTYVAVVTASNSVSTLTTTTTVIVEEPSFELYLPIIYNTYSYP